MKAIRSCFVGAVVITSACADVTLTGSDSSGVNEQESIVTPGGFVEVTY